MSCASGLGGKVLGGGGRRLLVALLLLWLLLVLPRSLGHNKAFALYI
jgi:hypothetical protein